MIDKKNSCFTACCCLCAKIQDIIIQFEIVIS